MTTHYKTIFWQIVGVVIATLFTMFIGWMCLELLSTGATAVSAASALKAHEKLDLETTKLQNDSFEREIREMIKRLDRIETKIDKLQEGRK